MDMEVHSMEDILNEMRCTQRALPMRPTQDQYQTALISVSRADNLLAENLEKLVTLIRPSDIPQSVFRAFQELREDVLRYQVEEVKKPWLSVIELEDRHRRCDALFFKISNPSAYRNGSFKQISAALTSNESSITDDLRSFSSGELSADDILQENGFQDLHPHPPHPPHPQPHQHQQLHHQQQHQHRVNGSKDSSEITLASPRSSPTSAPSSQSRSFAPDPVAATAVLSTIDEGGGSTECPPKLIIAIRDAQVKGLETLDLSNMFNVDNFALPESIGHLITLKSLNLSSNRINKLPESIGNLSSLTHLNLHANQLTSLPDSIGRLGCLRSLDLEKNAIEELPWTIGSCEALEDLRIDFNRLKALPEAVGYLRNLRYLSAHLNCLKSLPTTMASLSNLEVLDVHFNQLENIPEGICYATNLRKLDVASNFHALQALPNKIGMLVNLVELNVSYNSISQLPDSFVELIHLEKLHLDGNPWRLPPLTVTQQGKQAVFEYMSEYVKQKQIDAMMKKKRGIVSKMMSCVFGFVKKCCEREKGIF